MATYDLAYPGAAIDAILNTAYYLQEAGYIFRGSASDYSSTPSAREWVIAPAGFSGLGLSSAVPQGSIGICLYNGTAWVGKIINVVTLDSQPTPNSTNAVQSGAVYNMVNTVAQSISAALDSMEFADETPSADQASKVVETLSMTRQGVTEVAATLTLLAATPSKAGLMSAADKAKVDSFLANLRSLTFADTTASADQATQITETLKATIGGVQEVIDSITLLAATSSKAGLLSAADKDYIDALPTTLTNLSNSISGALALMQSLVGYYVCDTAAGTAAKTVDATGYSLTNGGCIRIKMANANTADNATLNINSTGAKALYYDGAQASSTNTWEAGEVLEVYYDGTQYQCASGGGGKFASGEKVKDVSITDTLNDTTALIESAPVKAAVNNIHANIGYFTCDTAAATAAKVVNASGYVLTNGGNIRVKMANANTAANVTLNINSTGAKALYYNGEQASASNSWKSGDTLIIYYDGTKYLCDAVQSLDVDERPTRGSENLARSGGIYDFIMDITRKTVIKTFGQIAAPTAALTSGQVSFGFVATSETKIRKIIFDLDVLTSIATSQGVSQLATGINIGKIENGRLTVTKVLDFVVDLTQAEQDVSEMNIILDVNECIGVGNTTSKLFGFYGSSDCYYFYNKASGKLVVGNTSTTKYKYPSYILEYEEYEYVNIGELANEVDGKADEVDLVALSGVVENNATSENDLKVNKDLTIAEFDCDPDYVYWCTSGTTVGTNLDQAQPRARNDYRGLKLQVKAGDIIKVLLKPQANYFGYLVITDENLIVTEIYQNPNVGTEFTFENDGYLFVTYNYVTAPDGMNTAVLSVPNHYYSNIKLKEVVNTQLIDMRNYLDARIDEIIRSVGNGAVVNFYSFKDSREDIKPSGWQWNSNGYYINTGYFSNSIYLNRAYAVEGRFYAFDFEAQTGIVYCGAATHFGNNYGEGSLFSIDIDNRTLNIHKIDSHWSPVPPVIASTNITVNISGIKLRAKVGMVDGNNVIKLYSLIDNTLLGTVQSMSCQLNTSEQLAGLMLDSPELWGTAETKLYDIVVGMDCKSQNCYCYITGDSITQGARLYEDYGYSFGQQMAAALPNLTIAISGRSSGHWNAVLAKMSSEAAILKPKYVMSVEGNNDHRDTDAEFTAHLQSFLDDCIAIGAEPIICHPPHRTKTADNTLMSVLIDQFIASSSTYIRCVKMDVACSIGCDYSRGEDTSLFPDGVHPNKAGHTRMFERIKIDCPELFMF